MSVMNISWSHNSSRVVELLTRRARQTADAKRTSLQLYYESDVEKLNVISTSHVGELTSELEYSSFILHQSYILHFNKDNHIIFA